MVSRTEVGAMGFNWLLLSSRMLPWPRWWKLRPPSPCCFQSENPRLCLSPCLAFGTFTPSPLSRFLAIFWSRGGPRFVSRRSNARRGDRKVCLWSPKPCNLARKAKASWVDWKLLQMRPCWTRDSKWLVRKEDPDLTSVGSMCWPCWRIWYNGQGTTHLILDHACLDRWHS